MPYMRFYDLDEFTLEVPDTDEDFEILKSRFGERWSNGIVVIKLEDSDEPEYFPEEMIDEDEIEAEEVQARTQTFGRTFTPRRDLFDHEVRAAVDFAQLQSAWEDAAEDIVEAWRPVREEQIDALIGQIESAVAAGDAEGLAAVSAPALGQDLIAGRMREIAEEASEAARNEAIAQGIEPPEFDVVELDDIIETRARAVALLMSRSLSEAAGRQALQRYGVNALSAADVAEEVRDHLEGLTDTYAVDQLGGALTHAQNVARTSVFRVAGAQRVYASELLDVNTCDNCRPIDGRKYDSVSDAEADYPTGGYKDCLGGPRCRGTLVAVYDESDT